MTTIKINLDDRRLKKDGSAPLRMVIRHGTKVKCISIDRSIDPNLWDKINNRLIESDAISKTINNFLSRIVAEAEKILLMKQLSNESFEISELVDDICLALFPDKTKKTVTNNELLLSSYEKHMSSKTGKTLMSYKDTLNRLQAFQPNLKKVRLEDVTRSWLIDFDNFMAKTSPSPNARAVHMRNLRAVFNFAIDEGYTNVYPFRGYKIKTVKTVKRSLKVEDIRKLFSLNVTPADQKYLDLFKLMFLLVGINSVDLLNLKHENFEDGRIMFYRSKTKRFYSIKVEPEAQVILDKYKGKDWLLDPLDKVGNYEFYRNRMNRALRSMGDTTIGRHGKKISEPLFPTITTYWARHSWATVARSIGISIDDIALALGHGDGHELTHIYIDEDLHKIDEANRKVIDWVFYGKK